MNWSFRAERETFPWMFLKLTPRDPGDPIILSRGLCAPEIASGSHEEKWRITSSKRMPPGVFDAEAFFLDNSKRVWAEKSGPRRNAPPLRSVRVSLGQLKVETSQR